MQSLQDFVNAGITLWIEGDKLKYEGPGHLLSADVVAQLRMQKKRLLEELTHQSVGRLDGCSNDPAGKGYSHPELIGLLRTAGRLESTNDEIEGLAHDTSRNNRHIGSSHVSGFQSQATVATTTLNPVSTDSDTIANHRLADDNAQQHGGLATLAVLAALSESDASGLADWIARVRHASNKERVFAVLDQFRPLPWTDEQRALMSRAYIAQLQRLQAGGVEC